MSPRSLPFAAVLLAAALPVFSATRQSIGGAFEKDYKTEKKPVRKDFTPEDRKRLMAEVSRGFYEDGLKARKAGRLSEALALFERALSLDPGLKAAKTQIADIKRLTRAPKVQKSPSRDSSARLVSQLFREGELQAKNGKWSDARLTFNKILSVDPDNGRAKSKLAMAEARLFDHHKRRGEERERAGDAEGALDAYQDALAYGDDPAVEARLVKLKARVAEANRKRSDEIYADALSASQQGHNDKALTLCRRALRIDPSNIQAQRMLERLERRHR